MSLASLFSSQDPSLHEVFLRLALAAVCGGIVGFEREHHGRAAGLRTTLLVCLAACVASILSEFIFHEAGANQGTWRPDPARLAQGILAGMGFLGAGVVVREGKFVRGVTTAAVLWFVTVIGLTLGSGHYALGLMGFLLAMLALILLPYLERFIAADLYGTIVVTLAAAGASDGELCKAVAATGVVVKELAFDHDLAANTRVVRLAIKFRRGNGIALPQTVGAQVAALPGVQRVQWV